ncbi:MAG: peptide deformylase [Clostridia bacterium]|nr:peptide deformylase [Oscillospiraceae bacterium]MBR4893511.1 peptide deformylase [Clostridia bacterium]
MAIRNIIKEGDPVLNKKSRIVEKIDERILTLLDDMKETMYDADGVGLAAPQVGILKRVVVIDVGDGVLELINPEIVCSTGEQYEVEGCLSLPGVSGVTERPMNVQVRALDREGYEVLVTGTGLLARALCHEIDHLDGILFRQRVTEYLE